MWVQGGAYMSLPVEQSTRVRMRMTWKMEGIGRQRTEATSNRSSPTVYCSMAYFRFPGLVSLS